LAPYWPCEEVLLRIVGPESLIPAPKDGGRR